MNRLIVTFTFLFLVVNIAFSLKTNHLDSIQLENTSFLNNSPGEDEEPPDDPIVTLPIPPDTIIFVPIETILAVDSLDHKL